MPRMTRPGTSPHSRSSRAARPAAAGRGPPAPFNELGRADAPVTIVEFSDLQCPHCARHAAQVLPELRRHYVDTGKLRYVARDLPLPMHAQAFQAAVVARCAGEQGRFWEVREALSMARMRLGEETYATLAREFGSTPRASRPAVVTRAGRRGPRRHGRCRQARIRSTPTFVISRTVEAELQGEIVTGSKDYATFARRMDALLAAPR